MRKAVPNRVPLEKQGNRRRLHAGYTRERKLTLINNNYVVSNQHLLLKFALLSIHQYISFQIV